MRSNLELNLRRVRARIEAAREAADSPGAARLMAITKRNPPADALAIHALGVEDLGENRLEGLTEKTEWFAREAPEARPRWHFVGHVQRNKARRVAQLADEIHSVDSLRLLETLERVCAEEGRAPRVYLQLKLTEEERKQGLDPDRLDEALAALAECRALVPGGLMAMAAPAEDEAGRAAALEVFLRLAELARRPSAVAWDAGRPLLSMGMSSDLEQAVRAGSDWLRIGSALFEDPPGSEEPAPAEDAR